MKRYAILDRDGTINQEVNYLSHPDQVVLLPNAAQGLRKLMAAGFGLVVVTNQSGIGRGYFDMATLEAIHARLKELLLLDGVRLDGIYYCPHRPEDRCHCRKPAPGLVERAFADHHFGPSDCFVVGDNLCDIALGKAANATTVLVKTGYGHLEAVQQQSAPDFIAADLAEAADIIIGAKTITQEASNA